MNIAVLTRPDVSVLVYKLIINGTNIIFCISARTANTPTAYMNCLKVSWNVTLIVG